MFGLVCVGGGSESAVGCVGGGGGLGVCGGSWIHGCMKDVIRVWSVCVALKIGGMSDSVGSVGGERRVRRWRLFGCILLSVLGLCLGGCGIGRGLPGSLWSLLRSVARLLRAVMCLCCMLVNFFVSVVPSMMYVPGWVMEGGSMRSCRDGMGRSRMCCVRVVALLKSGCCGLVGFRCCMQRASAGGGGDLCEGVYMCVLIEGAGQGILSGSHAVLSLGEVAVEVWCVA